VRQTFISKLDLAKIIMGICVLTTVFSGVKANATDDHFSYRSGKVKGYEKKVEVIENFFQKTVPGLDVSYREAFDILIADGQDIYVKGGLIRDLLAPVPKVPHDVDFVFSGTKEEILAVANKHKWQYTTQPDYSLIAIGDYSRVCLEGVSREGFLPTNKNQLEFTINNIYYHVNSRSFVVDSEQSFEDLEHSRLRVLAKDWKEWLYGSHGRYRYAKLFRVWKMIGKGYIYQIDFETFIRKETLNAQEDDIEGFNKELLKYLSNHFESFEDISRGSYAVMGDEWQSQFILTLREEAEKGNQLVAEKMKEFTFLDSDES
jgi:hypothetical protein